MRGVDLIACGLWLWMRERGGVSSSSRSFITDGVRQEGGWRRPKARAFPLLPPAQRPGRGTTQRKAARAPPTWEQSIAVAALRRIAPHVQQLHGTATEQRAVQPPMHRRSCSVADRTAAVDLWTTSSIPRSVQGTPFSFTIHAAPPSPPPPKKNKQKKHTHTPQKKVHRPPDERDIGGPTRALI